MKIKKRRNKKVLISAAICLALGGILGGVASTSSQGELNSVVAKNSEIVSEISSVTTTLESKENEFRLLELQEADLESKREDLVKLEEETKEQLDAKVKEEARVKAAEEARLQAEVQAKAEAQAKAQSGQASSSINSTQNSTGGSNGSSGGGSSGTVASTPSSESSSIKVWKTATGKKYHKTNNCGNTNSSNATLITITQAENLGLTPCSKCY